MSTKIKSAKLKRQLFLEATYTEHLPGHASKEIKITSNIPVHEDLRRAFADLNPLLASLCEQPLLAEPETLEGSLFQDGDVEKAEPKQMVECRGLSIGGSDDGEGVTLIGRRELNNGKILNLNSPFQKYDDEDSNVDTGDLYNAVTAVLGEVELYLFEGKRAPDLQGQLFEGGEETELEEEGNN